jgi:CheY-like chemotaxis protein
MAALSGMSEMGSVVDAALSYPTSPRRSTAAWGGQQRRCRFASGLELALCGRPPTAGGHMSAAARILVVDDEPPIRKLLRMGLGAHGYEVLEAPNGKTALELLGRDPALVILDLGLPDIDGLELLGRIREARPTLPVVVLSSRGDEGGKVEALDMGGRRLCHEAVRHERAARPHAGGAAPPTAGPG